MFEIRVNDADLQKLENILKGLPNAMNRVMIRGLNRTAEHASTVSSRFLSARLGWRKKDVQKYIKLIPASEKRWASSLRFPVKPIDVIKLRAKAYSGGVSYKDPVKNQRVRVKHAFIQQMPKRGKQVWLRSKYYLGRAKYITWRGRKMEALYPLKKGPSLHTLFFEHSADDAKKLYDESASRLAKNIHDQVELILRSRAG